MTTPRLSLSIVFAILMLLLAASARADHARVDELALELQSQVGQLNAEIRGNFRHASNFPHLVSESQQLYGLAAQARVLSRANVNPRQIEDLVHRMDRLVHRLEDRVDDANDFPGHVHLGHHAHCDTRFAERLLASIDRTLVRLDDAARDLSRRGPRYDFDNDYGRGRQIPAGGYYYQSNGLTFGGRGISVQFGR
jgi:hypothetical protein